MRIVLLCTHAVFSRPLQDKKMKEFQKKSEEETKLRQENDHAATEKVRSAASRAQSGRPRLWIPCTAAVGRPDSVAKYA